MSARGRFLPALDGGRLYHPMTGAFSANHGLEASGT